MGSNLVFLAIVIIIAIIVYTMVYKKDSKTSKETASTENLTDALKATGGMLSDPLIEPTE